VLVGDDEQVVGWMQVEDALGAGKPEKLDDLRAAIDASRRRRRAVEALAHQETLDERIKEALDGLAGPEVVDDDDQIRYGETG